MAYNSTEHVAVIAANRHFSPAIDADAQPDSDEDVKTYWSNQHLRETLVFHLTVDGPLPARDLARRIGISLNELRTFVIDHPNTFQHTSKRKHMRVNIVDLHPHLKHHATVL